MSLGKVAVYAKMAPGDIFDFVLLSVIHSLLMELHIRCGTKYRESRIETMIELLLKVEQSYKGYIPDAYKNKAERFLKMMHLDMDEVLKAIKTIKE